MQSNIREIATIAMFVLAAYVVSLIAFVPALGQNELFKTATILILGTGGFGLVCAYMWGGSKASVAAVDTVNAIAAGAPSTGAPQRVTVDNTADNPVPITDNPDARDPP